MKTISISELHERTDEWIRVAAEGADLGVTHQGKTIVRIVPEDSTIQKSTAPYFSNRPMSPEFAAYLNSGKICGGPDITQLISEDRDR
jgi:antitoxin (DNA-binding transcriptional repressor) of toxin-antitoxin stability system